MCRTQNPLVVGDGQIVHGLRNAEIGDFHSMIGIHHHIVRFDVFMDNVVVVGLCHTVAELNAVIDGKVHRQRACTADDFLQRMPLHILHNQIGHAVAFTVIVNIDDILMRKPCYGLCLLLEAAGELGVVCIFVPQ